MDTDNTDEYSVRADIDDLRESVYSLIDKQEEVLDAIQKSTESIIEAIRSLDMPRSNPSDSSGDDMSTDVVSDIREVLKEIEESVAVLASHYQEEQNRKRHDGIKVVGLVDEDYEWVTDEDFEHAKALVSEGKKVSIASLQRSLSIDRIKASQIMDKLTDEGVVTRTRQRTQKKGVSPEDTDEGVTPEKKE